ncbi:hypothetical protein [Pseudomonas jinjuensis]|uniref:Uncharacterized protein n=1 Tax=Pseudomonas jinjuensis TaxID=198616 RepID=A0A1H0QD11_9PSED|nr:hypothetical protein [Pseudomonas jinjuensis]SDP14579.1 hypothetical protein SAMN05216193_12346 [Pseudomonas jinjuensis]
MRETLLFAGMARSYTVYWIPAFARMTVVRRGFIPLRLSRECGNPEDSCSYKGIQALPRPVGASLLAIN